MPVQAERNAELVSWRGKCIHDMPAKHLQIILRLQALLGKIHKQRRIVGMIDIARSWNGDTRSSRVVTMKPHFIQAQHIIALPLAKEFSILKKIYPIFSFKYLML